MLLLVFDCNLVTFPSYNESNNTPDMGSGGRGHNVEYLQNFVSKFTWGCGSHKIKNGHIHGPWLPTLLGRRSNSP